MRVLLTEFIDCNASYFRAHCHPETVKEHVQRMRQPCVWGSDVEIIALAAILDVPVYVAIRKNPQEYYWCVYSTTDKARDYWVYPSNCTAVTTTLDHIEICHENSHYDVVVTANGSIPVSVPPRVLLPAEAQETITIH